MNYIDRIFKKRPIEHVDIPVELIKSGDVFQLSNYDGLSYLI